jgi:hypothetical protein
MNHALNEDNSLVKEPINIEGLFVYKTEDHLNYYKQFIVSAPKNRDWMDEESAKFSYHCLPLVSANTLGWWILNSQELEVEWDGSPDIDGIRINDLTTGRNYKLAASHFGSGILTFNVAMLFKTPPGWGLWVGGPSNVFIDGLFPLEGIVETNWSPFTFTMNYKITRANHKIKIPKYHPICRIVPIPLNLNEKSNLKIKYLKDYPELDKMHSEWTKARKENLEEGKNKNEHKRMLHYKNGTNVKGCPFAGLHKLFYKYKNPHE